MTYGIFTAAFTKTTGEAHWQVLLPARPIAAPTPATLSRAG